MSNRRSALARRSLVVTAVAAGAMLGAGQVAQALPPEYGKPPTSTVNGPEYKVSFSAEHVRVAHERVEAVTFVCSVAGEFAPKFVGRICDLTPQETTEAFTEAYHRKCGVDMFVIDGPRSYDAKKRFVVCP